MPKMNIDETVFEPIELVLNGKTYTVNVVDQTMFDRVKEAAEKAKDEGMNVVYLQLGTILGVEASEFKGLDLRKASAALKFLTDSITSQIEGKSGNA